MSQNLSVENAKSVPSMVELSSSIFGTSSDHSISSYKSCTDAEADAIPARIEKSTAENRPSVKVLIDKHRSFQDKLARTGLTDLKKKSYVTDCENLNVSYDGFCRNMEGDTKRVDKVENFVSYIHVLRNKIQWKLPGQWRPTGKK